MGALQAEVNAVGIVDSNDALITWVKVQVLA